MRDIALTLFVFGMVPLIFWRPHYGALMWAWIGMMIPHRLTFGFAHYFPFAQVVAIATLLALVLTKKRHPLPSGPIIGLLITFMIWMSFTSLFGIAPYENIFTEWERVMKIHLMLLVTLMLIRGREQIDQLVWVMVLSIGFYGVKGGVWTVLTGGGERVWGPPGGIIGGNNELALALVMLVPLMYYLLVTSTRWWIKAGLVFAMVTSGFAILGTHSRGALLAIGAGAVFLSLKAKRPVLMLLLIAIVGAWMIAYMPDNWEARMRSIESFADSSAQNRLLTWQTIINMVWDHPIVGGGFDYHSAPSYLGYAPIPMRAWAPHSTYFQALGEHGFIGLAIFLALMLVAWRRAGALVRSCKGKPGQEWIVQLMRMVQVALAGFSVGGAFLTMLHFDYLYYLVGLVVLVELAAKQTERTTGNTSQASTSTPRMPHLASGPR